MFDDGLPVVVIEGIRDGAFEASTATTLTVEEGADVSSDGFDVGTLEANGGEDIVGFPDADGGDAELIEGLLVGTLLMLGACDDGSEGPLEAA